MINDQPSRGEEEMQNVVDSYEKAATKHQPMTSPHEGLAVIWEEFEELKAEVFKQTIDPAALRKEALHVTAMGLRFLIDVCQEEQ